MLSRIDLLRLVGVAWLMASVGAAFGAVQVQRNLEYARVGDVSLTLDLHRADSPQRGPLIIWVHGGAWRSGSKTNMPLRALVELGYPVASVDYRLSPVAKFPAQIHDIKAAIRFMRGKGRALQVDASQIVVAGDSAGGHLAALVGVSNEHPDLEGTVGAHLKESSAVQGIVSFYGAANLTTILKQSTPAGLKVREPALELLLGALPERQPELARLASPVCHVDKSDPPLLLFHGDQDPQMPINQAHELQGAYEKHGRDVKFVPLHGAAHGGKEFYDEPRRNILLEFLRTHVATP